MIYLIGIDHTVQHRRTLEFDRDGPMGQAPIDQLKLASIQDLQACIRDTAKNTGATVIAEEFSNDAMAMNQITATTVAEVAAELGVRHLLCDPNRDQLGDRSPAVREEFWVTKLTPHREAAVILVCGDQHIDTFPKVLSRHGLQCQVVRRKLGFDIIPHLPTYT